MGCAVSPRSIRFGHARRPHPASPARESRHEAHSDYHCLGRRCPPSTVAVAQDASARTVQYHSQDIVPIRAKVKYTTLIFSCSGKKTPSQRGAGKEQPPQPMLLDNTDNNVQDLKSQLQAERQKEQQQATLAAATGTEPTIASTPTGVAPPCAPGQPCPQAPGYGQQSGGGQPQLSPEQEQAQQIAARERERADESRFASNLVFTRSPDQSQPQNQAPQQTSGQTMPARQHQADSSLISPRAPGDEQQATESERRPLEANIDSATGQPYLVYEGTVLDTILMNRLDGDAGGPVKVLVSNPLYSHDRQHVVIPEGTVVLGEAKKIGATGFGQQRRMAVVFHRLIMPDGYSVGLDQFHGLDQIGEEGLKDKVNNNYLEIIGTSIALGIVAGAGEITQGGGTITTSGSQAFTTGAASSVSQSATTILDRFIQIPPTITIREGA